MSKLRPLCLLLLALPLLGAAPSPVAVRLVRAVQADRMGLDGMVAAVDQAVTQGRATPKERDCVLATDQSVFVAPTAAALQERLSPEELAAGAAFFEGPSGARYAAISLVQLHHALGMDMVEQEPALDEADKKAMSAFAATPAGAKLIGPQNVFQDTAVKFAARPQIVEIVGRCRGTAAH